MRMCTQCGKQMNKGYCVDQGSEHYCSDECLHSNYTEEEWIDLYESGDSYYTEWCPDDTIEE